MAANTPPQWFDNLTNSTTGGAYILHSVRWTDDMNLSGYIFEFDNGNGTFYNDSFVTFSGTNNHSNVSRFVNATVDSAIRWRVYSNDSSDAINSTDIFSYNTLGPPTIDLDLIFPTGNVNVTKDGFFKVTVNVTCRGSDCGEINVSLDPFQFGTKSVK